MPVIRDDLQSAGALVDIELAWSVNDARRLRAMLRPVPPPITVRALLDSGAEVSCVDTSLIQTLGVPLAGTSLANLPAHGGTTPAFFYGVYMTILHPSGNAHDNLVAGNLSVLAISLTVLGYQALIGRDVLAKCRFVYNGPGNRFMLAY